MNRVRQILKVVSRLRTMMMALCLCAPLLSPSSNALDWQSGDGFRSAPAPVPKDGQPGFTLQPQSVTGIAFTNILPQARHLTNQVLLNGSGVAAGDVDGDGWCDLFFCGLDRPSALYRNLGNWKFEEISAAAGVALPGGSSTGAAFADIDGDGDFDLVVNSVGHGTHLLLNDGKGRFTTGAVLNDNRAGMSLALGDLDGDGFLDLYVANYRTLALMDMPNTLFNFGTIDGRRVISKVNGRPVTDPDLIDRFRLGPRGGIEENGEPDQVYRNDGGKSFTPLSFTNGVFLDEEGRPLASQPLDWGLSVMIRDLNQDGLPDIWVCNDFDTPDRVWLNQGRGRFRAAPRRAFRKSSHFSMGIDVADINRDGFDDVFVVDMLSRDHVMRMDMQGDRNPPVPGIGLIDYRPDYMMNTLFLNRGDGTYAEIAQLAGLAATEWSWTPLFLDVDLDGYEDLLVANGHERAARSMDVADQLRALRANRKLSVQEVFENRKLFPRQNSPNVAFHNRGDLTFEDKSKAWGFAFDGVSHGMALADLDNDGDLDVIVNNLNDAATVYRNNSSAPRLAVRLKGAPPNTRGIGARITVRGPGLPAQNQEVIAGGRYLSSDDPMRVFAAGSPTNRLTIEVAWRGGARSLITNVEANRVYEVDETRAGVPPVLASKRAGETPALRFTDASSLLTHAHHDDAFDDFAPQPLLPDRFSQLGPGLTWADIDGDGWEDLVVGSGKGGQMAVFRNDGRGGFQRLTAPPFNQLVTRDQTTILKWQRGTGDVVLLAGSANYEDGLAIGPVAREYNLVKRVVQDSLPGQASSTGPMALADIDGDGQLDLFVGGRVIAGRYPEPASSMILRGTGEKFELDAENAKQLANIGLVSGAVFSDLDADGDVDLILACEWGPLRLFRNDQGRLVPWDWRVSSVNSQLTTLNQLAGRWNGVTTGDFDGDGRLDIAASNWGRNTRQESHRGQPLQLIFGDLDGDGSVEIIEAYFDPDLKKVVPERNLDFLGKAMPFLRERFTSHLAFGRAGVREILGERWKAARQLQVNWLESTVFLNRGDHFEARILPVEAQMAPAFAVCAGDLDGDGREDIFLSQNFFATQPDTPRYDGGVGLWLQGDGRGGFSAVPPRESGISIYGEQRGAALCDFDHDGRVDLAVGQNGTETKLYKNVAARPGLRVRLIGAAGNPDAIGASLRLLGGGTKGPLRELRAGAGYWSQDSAAQVMNLAATPSSIWVRWPGGKVTTNDIPAGAPDVVLDVNGKLTAR